MRDHTAKALQAARKLRKEMSLPEVLLWRILKQRPDGLKFRIQHPIGAYVADFYCAKRRVIIEIDGIAHDMGDRPERDALRDERLREAGFEILRIPAVEVLKNLTAAAGTIIGSCLAAPPPPEGEDFSV
jgi:very-short-patch-repair endonuclease